MSKSNVCVFGCEFLRLRLQGFCTGLKWGGFGEVLQWGDCFFEFSLPYIIYNVYICADYVFVITN